MFHRVSVGIVLLDAYHFFGAQWPTSTNSLEQIGRSFGGSCCILYRGSLGLHLLDTMNRDHPLWDRRECRESLRSFSGGANLEDHPKRGSKWFKTHGLGFVIFLMDSACHGKFVGIQSPNLRMAMEPKYLSEVVIIHPVLIIWRSVIGSLGNHH